MKKLVIFVLLALLLTLGATPVYAGVPALPHAFYGSVTINGSSAPDDTQISATVDEGDVLTTSQNPVMTLGDSYGIDSPKLLVQGDGLSGDITFYVDGIVVEGVTATFEVGGGPTEMTLDLVITDKSITGEVVAPIPAGEAGYEVDASDIADTTITVDTTGDVTITVKKYYSDPHPGATPPADTDMLPRYIDIDVDNPDAIDWPMYVEQTYTDTEVEGLDEPSLGMCYFTEEPLPNGAWHRCSNTGVDTEDNYVWAYIEEDELPGSPVAIGGVAPPSPAGAGIGPRRVPLGTTDVRGEVSAEGVFEEPVTAFSEDELCTLTIPEGTVGLTEDLEPLDEITMVIEDAPPPPPEDAEIVGLAYDFGPDGATFEPVVTLTWSYDPADIPEDKDVLVVAYYDEVAEAWVYLEGEVNTVTKIITVSISHFTTFAIIARAAPPLPPVPAAFSVTNLSVKPLEVELKEVVTISLSVANTGGTKGSYTVVLKINGVKEADKSITIAAGKSQDVSFSVAKEKAGSYSVVVDGLSASFTVVEPVPEEVVAPPEEEEVVPEAPAEVPPAINWPVLGLVIAAVVVAGVLIFLLVRRRAY